MATEILNGNDFFALGQLQVDASGQVLVPNEHNEDYSMALVSRNVYDFSGGTKSVRFVFSANPYKYVALDSDQVDASANRIGYLNRAGDATIIADLDTTAVSEAIVPNIKKLSVSNTNSILLSNEGQVSAFGDNTFGQTDVSTYNMAIDVAAGNDFTAILNADGTIVVLGDNASGDFDIPLSLSTFDTQDQPIAIDAGDNFIAVLRKDATIVVFGTGNEFVNVVPVIAESTKAISCGNNFVMALGIAGNLTIWGDDTTNAVSAHPGNRCQYIKAGVNRASAITEDGRALSWGENVVDGLEINQAVDAHAVLTIAGHNYSLSVARNGTVTSAGSIPVGVSSIVELIGNFADVLSTNPEYEHYPILKETDSLNIAFGIQDANLSPDYNLNVTNNAVEPIIVGHSSFGSVFESMHGAVKGAILTKAFGNKDACFDLTGNSYDPFSTSGHRPVASDFVTTSDEEKYEAIVSFGPFGKIVKFRKLSGAYANEMPYNIIELNNTPYDSARVALYIRGAQDFILHTVSVTDEIDTAILPPEVLFRNMDTAVLQTRAAQSMIDIMDTMSKIKDGLITTSDSLVSMGENHRDKIANLETRVTNIGG